MNVQSNFQSCRGKSKHSRGQYVDKFPSQNYTGITQLVIIALLSQCLSISLPHIRLPALLDKLTTFFFTLNLEFYFLNGKNPSIFHEMNEGYGDLVRGVFVWVVLFEGELHVAIMYVCNCCVYPVELTSLSKFGRLLTALLF